MGKNTKKAQFDSVSKTTRRSFLRNTILLGTGGLLAGSINPALARKILTKNSKKRKLRPTLAGDWWLIGSAPHDDLKPENKDTQIEPVDHHILKAEDGYWHLWGCVRDTKVGRVLYHWRAKNLEDSPWEETGEIIRCDSDVGECIDDYYGQEWIQSPYFVQENGKYYMFYGGHSTGKDKFGNPVSGLSENRRDAECQICLMTSDDGLNWTRYKNQDGLSRVFIGPGQTRDPCLINIDGIWHMYYAGDEEVNTIGGTYLRTSRDLIHWSDYKLVHYDATFGETTWDHECPHVVYREGYFYLLRTESYTQANTHVYRSENPRDFGTNAESAQPLYVERLECAAPEIYQVDGSEYVSSNHNPPLGTQMCRLKWEPE